MRLSPMVPASPGSAYYPSPVRQNPADSNLRHGVRLNAATVSNGGLSDEREVRNNLRHGKRFTKSNVVPVEKKKRRRKKSRKGSKRSKARSRIATGTVPTNLSTATDTSLRLLEEGNPLNDEKVVRHSAVNHFDPAFIRKWLTSVRLPSSDRMSERMSARMPSFRAGKEYGPGSPEYEKGVEYCENKKALQDEKAAEVEAKEAVTKRNQFVFFVVALVILAGLATIVALLGNDILKLFQNGGNNL